MENILARALMIIIVPMLLPTLKIPFKARADPMDMREVTATTLKYLKCN